MKLLSEEQIDEYYCNKYRICELYDKSYKIINFLLDFIYSNFGKFSEELTLEDIETCHNDADFYKLLKKYYLPKSIKEILAYQNKIYEYNLKKKVSVVLDKLEFINLDSEIFLLDIGTENSSILDLFEKEIQNCNATGINIKDGFDHYNNKLFQKDIDSGKICIYDGYNFPFKNNQFDIVTIFSVIHHVKNIKLFVKNMCRITKYVIIKDNDMAGEYTTKLIEIQHDLYEGILCPQNFSEFYKTEKNYLINLMYDNNFSIVSHTYKKGFTNPYTILFKKNS